MEERRNNNPSNKQTTNENEKETGPLSLPKRSRIFGKMKPRRKLPRVYIGYSPRRLTYFPFCVLLGTSLIFLVGYVFSSVRFMRTIAAFDNLTLPLILIHAACILNASASLLGIRVLKKTIVTSCKLLLLHGVMFSAIVVHLVLPFVTFLSSSKYNSARREGKSFPVEYWKCRSSRANSTEFCYEVSAIGVVFWSSLIPFTVLLLAWRILLCQYPTPIHGDFDLPQEPKTPRGRHALTKIYNSWMESQKIDKPYTSNNLADAEEEDSSTHKVVEINDNSENATRKDTLKDGEVIIINPQFCGGSGSEIEST